jgi:hypothetical protein
MKFSYIFISVIFVALLSSVCKIVSVTKTPLSVYSILLPGSSGDSSEKYEKILTNFCTTHLNNNNNNNNSNSRWSCVLSIEHKFHCYCTQTYACFDTEQFHLETNLVNVSEYLKENSAYKKVCQKSLNKLTKVKNWKCKLQYDRLKNNEFFCECKRKTVCQSVKFLNLPLMT